jgi:uncharacterized protein
MKTLICTFAMLLVTSLSHAAPASKESIEALLVVSKTESILETMYVNMEQVMKQAMQQGMQQELKGQAPSPAQQRMIDSMPAKFSSIIREEMGWAKLKSMQIQIYSDTFEQADIDGLIAFYSSPTGQAFINKMPEVMQKTMAATQLQMQAIMPKMMSVMQQAAADAKQVK